MQYDHLKRSLKQIYEAALQAVDPSLAVSRFLRRNGAELRAGDRLYNLEHYRNAFLVGAGKAAIPMAYSVEQELGHHLQHGLVVVKKGNDGELRKTKILHAGHPEPDRAGLAAAEEILHFLSTRVTPQDLLLAVFSGGGSALLPAPVTEISFEDKQQTTAVLLKSGANIHEMNTIRKHLSRIKGGRLLDFTSNCEVVAMLLSDVVGDLPASIASGPTAPDPTTFEDCLQIVSEYQIREQLPESVMDYLERGARTDNQNGTIRETAKPGDPRFRRVHNAVIGSNILGLQAASRMAQELGFTPLILSSSMQGNVADLARFCVAMAREVLTTGNPLAPPCCLISGGEPTVQVRGDGKGGRNQEFALWCVYETARWQNAPVLFASIGSDGNDGPTDAAGASATPDSLQRAKTLGLEVRDHLHRNDSYHFFQPLDDLIFTGLTNTNVMDFQIVLIDKPATPVRF